MNEFPERVLAAASLLAALVFITAGIERPLFLDEANSVIIAGRGAAGVIDSLSRDNNLPLYYLVLSFWMRLFGDSEIALRSLSTLFYLGGCGVAFALGKRVSGNARSAAYCAFFYFASALAIRQAQNIRMYALLGMLSGLSTLALLRLLDERRRAPGGWIFYCAVTAAGLLTHVWFAFVVMAQFLAVLVFERRHWWRFTLAATAATVPFVLLWSRLFIEQLHNGATNWMPPLTPAIALAAPLEFFGVLPSILVFALLARSLRQRPAPRVRMMAAIFAATLGIPLFVSLVKPIYWPGRYTVIALMPLAVTLGSVLAAAAPRRLLALACVALLGMQAAQQVAGRESIPDSELPAGQSDRTAARFLLQHAAPGDGVVFTSLTRAPADYYFSRAGASGRFVEVSFPAENAAHLGWSDPVVTPARHPQLETEAAQMAERLQTIAERGARIWLYDGYAVEVSGFLKRKLDAELELRETHELAGPYHKRILEYGKKAGYQPR